MDVLARARPHPQVYMEQAYQSLCGEKLLEGRPQEQSADGSVDFFTARTQDSVLEKS